MKVVEWTPLNRTSLVDEMTWKAYSDTYYMDQEYEKKASVYFVVVAVTVLGIPLALTLLQIISPRPFSLAAKIKFIIVTSALWGRKFRVAAWGGAGLQPTRGLAILILYILIINLLLSVVDYPIAQPNIRYVDKAEEVRMGIGLRTGLLSFANMALSIFIGGRNTFLLWLTDWSPSMYLLIHRWVAYVSIIQAAVHCLVYLYQYSMEVLMWMFSVLPIHKRFYEAFLLGRILSAIITLLGCWYRVWYLYENLWGFEMLLYACFAAWGADRVFRVIRMAKWGVKEATITRIDDDYFRIDILNVAMEGHAFLYFPPLSWCFWENHPFSVASSIVGPSLQYDTSGAASPINETASSDSSEKKATTPMTNVKAPPPSHVSNQLAFLSRVEKGMTQKLAARCGSTVPVLIEGGYSRVSVGDKYPQVVAIVGGVGITTVLPVLRRHPGRAKVYLGARNINQVDHVRSSGMLDGIDVAEISVGKRLDVRSILDVEIDGKVKHVMVITSGPQAMADDVRAAVVNIIGRTGVNVKLVDERFSW